MGQDTTTTNFLFSDGHVTHLAGFSHFSITDEHIFTLRNNLGAENPSWGGLSGMYPCIKNRPSTPYQINQEHGSIDNIMMDLDRHSFHIQKTSERRPCNSTDVVRVPETDSKHDKTLSDPAQAVLNTMNGEPEWLTKEILQAYLHYAVTVNGDWNQVGEYGRLYFPLKQLFSSMVDHKKHNNLNISEELLTNTLHSNGQVRHFFLGKDESGAIRVHMVNAFISGQQTLLYHKASFTLSSDGNGSYGLKFSGGDVYINEAYPKLSRYIQSQLGVHAEPKKRTSTRLLKVLLSGFLGGFVGYFGMLPAPILGMMASLLVGISVPITPLFMGLLSGALFFSAVGLLMGASVLLYRMKSVHSNPIPVPPVTPLGLAKVPATSTRDARIDQMAPSTRKNHNPHTDQQPKP